MEELFFWLAQVAWMSKDFSCGCAGCSDDSGVSALNAQIML